MSQPFTSTAPLCFRSQTSQLITSVAVSNGEPRQSVFERIYARLLAFYSIDVYAYPRAKGESLLTVAERHDFIDKVYELAHADYQYLLAYEG